MHSFASAATARKRDWSRRIASRAGELGLAVIAFWARRRARRARSLPLARGRAVPTPACSSAISAAHWFGTDYLGRDMLARIIDGTRYTIGVALVATLLACGARHAARRCSRRSRAAGSTQALSRVAGHADLDPEQDVRAGDRRRLRLVGAAADRRRRDRSTCRALPHRRARSRSTSTRSTTSRSRARAARAPPTSCCARSCPTSLARCWPTSACASSTSCCCWPA